MSFVPFAIASVLVAACGPQVASDDSADEDSAEVAGGADDACGSGSCPDELFCGEFGNVCQGGFGIHPCTDGSCGPAPGSCYAAYQELRTCAEICGVTNAACVARACEGVTAFSYPGPPHLASGLVDVCGQNTEEVKSVVTEHTFDCNAELPWSDDVSLFQCCCDDPDR
jgi:hypothetical protein